VIVCGPAVFSVAVNVWLSPSANVNRETEGKIAWVSLLLKMTSPKYLIDALLRTAIEHAGAERGLLILPRGEEQWIEAEATTRGDTVAVHVGKASVAADVLPESIVNYVVRTRESVILDDASAQNPFSADTYIRQKDARSILCLPLLKQAKLIGVLYLE